MIEQVSSAYHGNSDGGTILEIEYRDAPEVIHLDIIHIFKSWEVPNTK